MSRSEIRRWFALYQANRVERKTLYIHYEETWTFVLSASPEDVLDAIVKYCHQTVPFDPVLLSSVTSYYRTFLSQYYDEFSLDGDDDVTERSLCDTLPWQQIIEAVASTLFRKTLLKHGKSRTPCNIKFESKHAFWVLPQFLWRQFINMF